ncbi:MAG TPA: prepilin-type N-terminal cleavage/methylation domain-containing protein [Sumerlaeia bacterium]|nr:prepilin-type N-terminal cleavage/methylation domain-containing protein [Sumerlaeia bacterium]
MRRDGGFTLIELLIVVAIIAILAAIAVPNFLEAQVRSKVARSHTDMRSIAVAMEAYCTDCAGYPPYYAAGVEGRFHTRLNVLSTPVAFMTSVPPDPFADRAADLITWEWHIDAYIYAPLANWGVGRTYLEAKRAGQIWWLAGRGPNLIFDMTYNYYDNAETQYDPTNGTRSYGDIERFGP